MKKTGDRRRMLDCPVLPDPALPGFFRSPWIIMLILGVVLAGPYSVLAQDFSVRSYLDQTTVALQQPFTLVVEISGKDANSAGQPQLPDLTKFAAFLGSGSSQNIQFVNGKMSASTNIHYTYQASALGKFQIGAVSVTVSGKTFQTQPIDITIVQGQAQAQTPAASAKQGNATQAQGPSEGELFIRASVNRREVFQNEPVIVTFKIYTLVSVSSFQYSKMPGTAGFWVEDYPIGNQPQATNEILDGKKYTVATIKKMAIFPMTSGSKTIEPLSIDCEVQTRRRSRDVFDDFFNDPFFGRTVKKTISSKPVTISVLPLPEAGKPADFTGAVGQYRLRAEVDKVQAKTNEAITYRLKVEGRGNIQTLSDLPVVFPSDFEVYPPKISQNVDRDESGVTGSKTFEYILVPRVAGLQKIKPVLWSMFDPVAKTYKTLQTPEIVIDVAKGSETYSAVPSGLSKEEVRLIGQDIRFIKTLSEPFVRIGRSAVSPLTAGAVVVLPLIFLAGAFVYRKHQDRLEGDVAYARNRGASRAMRRRFAKAQTLLKESTHKEFYGEMGRALLGYLADRLNVAEAGIISEKVKADLLKRGVDKGIVDEFFGCVQICDMKRFSPEESSEQEMKEFIHKAENAVSRLDRAIKK